MVTLGIGKREAKGNALMVHLRTGGGEAFSALKALENRTA